MTLRRYGGPVIVRFEQPMFPLRLAALPAGLSEPHYSLEGGRHLAVYPDAVYLNTSNPGGDDIYLAISSTPASAPVSRATTVDGGPAALRVMDQEISGYRFRSLSLEWERRPGQWVTVTGLQGRADENVVRRVAASLIEAPQPIALQLRIAPAGWS